MNTRHEPADKTSETVWRRKKLVRDADRVIRAAGQVGPGGGGRGDRGGHHTGRPPAAVGLCSVVACHSSGFTLVPRERGREARSFEALKINVRRKFGGIPSDRTAAWLVRAVHLSRYDLSAS